MPPRLPDLPGAADHLELCLRLAGWGLPASPVAALPVGDVAPGVRVHGPVSPYDDRVRELHRRGLDR